MKESELQKCIVNELNNHGYDPIEEYGVHNRGGVIRHGDIYIRDSNTVIEVKAEGSIRKGLGQCIYYESAEYNSALFVESYNKSIIEMVKTTDIPLVGVEVSNQFLYSCEFKCLSNMSRYKRLFDRYINPGDYHKTSSKEAYEEYAPNPDFDF